MAGFHDELMKIYLDLDLLYLLGFQDEVQECSGSHVNAHPRAQSFATNGNFTVDFNG